MSQMKNSIQVDLHPSSARHQAFVFRLNDNGVGPEAVRIVLQERGWEEFDEEVQASYDWNLWWKSSRFSSYELEERMPWQRINHFPNTSAITKKDTLLRNMKRMQGVYGASVYNFVPQGYNLPNDYSKFVRERSQVKHTGNARHWQHKDIWICKPADLSRGRGIFLFQDLTELTYDGAVVVQKYITNPLLIGGYKFDLRIYVVITSFQPLLIYMYEEGIVRFSTEKFDLDSISNVYCHLTNTSINKQGPSYMTHKETVGPGCKWCLTQLRNYLQQQNIDDDILWQRICSIVTLTMLIQAPLVPQCLDCVELFGFDILIDENLKPWLLEVNFGPSLSLDCPLDFTVKKAMLNDMFDLMGFQSKDANRGKKSFARMTTRQAHDRQTPRSWVDSTKLGCSVLDQAVKSMEQRLSLKETKATNLHQQSTCKTGNKVTQDGSTSKPGRTIKAASQMYVKKSSTRSSVVKQINIKAKSANKTSAGKDLNTHTGQLSPSRQETSDSSLPGDVPETLAEVENECHRYETSSRCIKGTYSSQQQIHRHRCYAEATGITNNPSRIPTCTCNRGRCATNKVISSRLKNSSTCKPAILCSNQMTKISRQPLKYGPQSHVKFTNAEKAHMQLPAQLNQSAFNNNEKLTKSTEKFFARQRSGGFILTFPFNEETRRASYTCAGLRIIIREIQKQLHYTVYKVASTKL